MIKTLILLLSFFIFFDISIANHNDLVWRSSIFRSPRTIKLKSYNRPTSKVITVNRCNIKKRSVNYSNNNHAYILQLNKLNEMRIKGVINNRDFKRKKGTIIKKWNRCYYDKNFEIDRALSLLEALYNQNGLNNREYSRIKKYILR